MKKIILLIMLLSCASKAQWETNVQLTNTPSRSGTSWNNARCIASSGDYLHVVWYTNRDGNYEIYYKRSADGGSNWGADTRLTNDPDSSRYPSITVSGSVVHIVWFEKRDGNNEIYYKRSTDGGSSWGADTRLTNNPAFSYYPSVDVSGSVVHVVWEDNRDGSYEIYYKRSTDAGVSWGADSRLTNNTAVSERSSVSISGSIVNVVWDDDRDGNQEIYNKRSTDGGITWGADIRVTNNPFVSRYPSVAVSGSNVHVVWDDERDGLRCIYYNRSTDGGISWGADSRLSDISAQQYYSSISISSQIVHVVWNKFFGVGQVRYKRSTDGGISWGSDTVWGNNDGLAGAPSLSVSGQGVHVVWNNFVSTNWVIFYKRNPNGNLTGIKNINSEVPNQFSLSQNYPNPFNPGTVISFELAVNSFVSLKVYDLLGREVSTLVNEQLNPGSYSVDFDGSNLSSGVYYYILTAGDYNETKKMILIK